MIKQMRHLAGKKSIRMLLMVIVFAFGTASCEYEFVEVDQPDPNVEVKFSEMILPIFSNNNCTACHQTGGTPPDLTADNVYNSIFPDLVNIDDPEASAIYTVPAPSSNHSAKYSPAQAALILAWIQQGALNN
jgi:hypothetical protein